MNKNLEQTTASLSQAEILIQKEKEAKKRLAAKMKQDREKFQEEVQNLKKTSS